MNTKDFLQKRTKEEGVAAEKLYRLFTELTGFLAGK
jgi:hypothetical protein